MNRITATFTIDSHTMTVAEVEKWAHDVIQGCKKSEKIWNMACSVTTTESEQKS